MFTAPSVTAEGARTRKRKVTSDVDDNAILEETPNFKVRRSTRMASATETMVNKKLTSIDKLAPSTEPHNNKKLANTNKRAGNKNTMKVDEPSVGKPVDKKQRKTTSQPARNHKLASNIKPSSSKEITNGKQLESIKALKTSPKRTTKAKGKEKEKRLARFRDKPPQSYLQVKSRALSQRLTVISRERLGTDESPEERVIMAGTTGNLYTQHIGHVPTCDCPHAQKGNQCKHLVYTMLRVLKAPEAIAIQLALTSSELRDLFQNAAPIPAADSGADGQIETYAETDGNRKPIEGDCCICYTEFEPDKEAIVYCKAACGNNVHRTCMQTWMSVKSGKATCPYCRSEWVHDDGGFDGKVDLQGATYSEDGYVNIASQLGLSGERDYSTYHPHWVRRQFGGRRRYRGRY